MKYLGLDIGTKRIGVAVGSTDVRIASPLTTLRNDADFPTALARLIDEYHVSTLVVGRPRNNSGKETAQTAYVYDFIKHIVSQLKDVKIIYQDESLTSAAAEDDLKTLGKTDPRKIRPDRAAGEVDARAAAIILQDFLEGGAQ
jgi:putative Holliday junction resolvase